MPHHTSARWLTWSTAAVVVLSATTAYGEVSVQNDTFNPGRFLGAVALSAVLLVAAGRSWALRHRPIRIEDSPTVPIPRMPQSAAGWVAARAEMDLLLEKTGELRQVPRR